MKELAQVIGPSFAQASFHEELAKHSEPLFLPATLPDGSFRRSSHRWKQELLDLVRAIVSPSAVDWMDDDGNFSTGEYCQRALYDVQSHFSERFVRLLDPLRVSVCSERFRGDWDLSTKDRMRLIDLLLKLPCLLSQCESKGCSQAPYAADVQTKSYSCVIGKLLNGTESVEVKQRVFQLMGAIVKHHTIGDASVFLENILLKGMQDANRNVRISAG